MRYLINMSEDTKKKKAKYLLENLDVREVSLVSRPAIGRKYILMKSADSSAPEQVSEEITTKASEEPENNAGTSPADLGVRPMNEKLTELLKSAELEDETISGALDTILEKEVPEEVMKSFFELAGYEIPTIEKEVEVKVEVEVPVEKAEEPVDEKEEILKGLSPEQEALFKSQMAELTSVKKSLADQALKAEEERQIRITKEFVQKAAEEYPALPGTAADLGPVLKAVSDKLEEKEAEAVFKIFNVANEAVAKSDQLIEKGSAGESDGSQATGGESAWVKKANQLVEKGDFDNFDQAVAHLVDTDAQIFSEDY